MSSPFALLRVRVQPESPAETPAEWVALDATGQVKARGHGKLGGLPAAESVELILPAARVSPHRLDVPASGARFEAALIRQALEDRVLGDLDRSVIVSGMRQDKWLTVWVADLGWLSELVEASANAQIIPASLTPEQSLLAPGELSEGPSGWIFLKESGEYGLLPSRELVLSIAGDALQEQTDLLAAAPQARRVNLITGMPRLKRARAGFSPALLKPAAVLLGAAAVVYLVAQIVTLRQLSGQEASLRQTIRQNFAAALPGVPIVDPILQWRQRQGRPAAGPGLDALDVLADFASQIGIVLHPQRIEVNDSQLKLTLTSADANALKPVLQQKGIGFDTGSTDNGLAQITIRQKAGGRP